MSQQFTLPEPAGRRTSTAVPQAALLLAELPRAVRGYSVEAVNELVTELESQIRDIQSKAVKLEESNRRLVEDLTRCASEVSAHREKESSIVAALLAVEERKKSVESEVDGHISSARAQAKEIIDRATLEAATIRQDAESSVAPFRLQADEILRKANEDASAIREQARDERETLLGEARTQAEEINADARRKLEEATGDIEAIRSNQEREVERLNSEYRQLTTSIRQAAEAALSAISAAEHREATPAAAKPGRIRLDSVVAAA